ncbi:hypothetical protein [Cohaesibacter celericrescens]|uniref:Uncharacterized protein n=1 Tax=Cohaesibacter celericrescens TaxID=2067669 RepID=A0A2N5XX63_9HYPH|nr:hypothetical protein [Cohaesibacter celericrescens]PLW79103.1 hypothetical protein C0081_02405 [Cohaesibacter celericrescens]
MTDMANDNIHEDDLPEQIGSCVACGTTIRDGDDYLSCIDGDMMCRNCSPTYQDILDNPTHLWQADTEMPFTQKEAQVFVNAHLSQGGKLTDKATS